MKRVLVAGILSLAAAGLHAADNDKSAVRRPGRYLVEYKDDKIQVLVGVRFASTRPAGQWLMLETFLTATGNTPVRIDREDIALVVGGTRVQLASQKALAEGVPDVRKMYTEASITRDPMEGYFVGPQRVERLGFFAPPTERIVYDRVTLERNTLSEGYLFFHAPGDKFPSGRYVLEIFNKDIDVKLPFALPAPALNSKSDDKDDKTVPW